MADDLKNCPCCDSSARFIQGKFVDGSGNFWRVYCPQCQLRSWRYQAKDEARTVWNRRVVNKS